jgi:sugar O-acyltransferase (sialic acid O-acetyltransferase NeuD family)
MNNIAIFGAGGFGREVRVMVEEIGKSQFLGFLDDITDRSSISNLTNANDLLVAVADPHARQAIVSRPEFQSFPFESVIHPSVYLSATNKIGRGCIICGGVKITTAVSIDDFVIINLNSVIGHDVVIRAFSSIMPSANILGGVTIGEGVFIGAGATILQNVSIGTGAIVGAGAVVTKPVAPFQKVMGVPARPKK